MRLHLLAAPDGTPRAAILAPADHKERDVALRLFAHRAARRRADRLRQGLRRPRVRGPGRRALRRDDPAPRAQERARPRPRAVLDPPTHRVDLLDAQRPPRPRTPPRPHACTDCARGSPPNSWPSARASGSTTTSASRPAPSPPSPPNATRNQSSRRRTPSGAVDSSSARDALVPKAKQQRFALCSLNPRWPVAWIGAGRLAVDPQWRRCFLSHCVSARKHSPNLCKNGIVVFPSDRDPPCR